MKSAAMKLASFDTGTGSSPALSIAGQVAKARDSGYAAGFRDGVAATAASMQSESHIFAGRLVESLADLNLTMTEADLRARQAFRPVLEAVMSAILPQLAGQEIAVQICEIAAQAVADHPGNPVTALVAPGDFARVRQNMGVDLPWVRLEPAPELAPLQARLEWANGAAALDYTACINECRTALATYYSRPEEAKKRDSRP